MKHPFQYEETSSMNTTMRATILAVGPPCSPRRASVRHWGLALLFLVTLGGIFADAAGAVDNFVWVANQVSSTVSKIDKTTGAVADTISLPGRNLLYLTVDGDSVWVVDSSPSGSVIRIDKTTDSVIATIPVGRYTNGLAADASFVWVAGNDDASLHKIDKSTNSEVATIYLGGTIPGFCAPPHTAFVAVDNDSVWVSGFGGYCSSKVWRINKATNSFTTLDLSSSRITPQGIGVDSSSVWVAAADLDTVIKINKSTNAVTNNIAVGRNPFGVAEDPDSVWVTNAYGSTVSRIRTLDNTVTATISGGSTLFGVAVDANSVWVASYYTGQLLKISKASNSIVATIGVGVRPDGVATYVPPTVPFAAFAAKLDILAGPPPEFDLKASFTLGAGNNGIDPLTEPVTLQVGDYSTTIPAGSFTEHSKGRFNFQGVINGVSLQVQITPLGGNSFAFKADAQGINLTGAPNPVSVALTIGDDAGTVAVTASFQ